jgi:hypothetical protein
MTSAVAILAAFVSGSALAAPPLPKERVDFANFTVLRLNPLGVQDAFDIGYRRRLYTSEEPLWRTGQVGASFAPTLTPAFVKLGIAGEIEPIAILRLQAKLEWIQYFGVADHLQSFQTVHEDYSDTAIKRGGDEGKNYAPSGLQAMLAAEFKIRFGPVVLRSRFQAFYSEMRLRYGDTVWYDPFYDLLTPATGWSIINDSDLLSFLLEDRLVVGIRHTLLDAFYPSDAYGPSGPQALDGYPTQRIGPLVAWHIYDHPGEALSRVTLLVLAQWHLSHPTRAGQDVNQAIPYVAIGCNLTGDLWRSDAPAVP